MSDIIDSVPQQQDIPVWSPMPVMTPIPEMPPIPEVPVINESDNPGITVDTDAADKAQARLKEEFAAKGLTLADAAAMGNRIAWIYAGRPYRSQQEIRDILQEHCQSCHYYRNDYCILCDLRVVANERSPLNMLSMATTNCPIYLNPKWQSELTPHVPPERVAAIRKAEPVVSAETYALLRQAIKRGKGCGGCGNR
jgi:hypothetical protein